MKELVHGIWSLIWALIVSSLMFSIGTVYSLIYSIYMSVTFKNKWMFFKFWWRLVDGFCAAAGHALYELAYALDMCWNVNGEILEDIITAKENTTFSQKNISVSATTGKLEIDGDLNKAGKIFSKALNFFFGQKQHAKDAWMYTKARKELKEQYFK
jgi:hypothetical protein